MMNQHEFEQRLEQAFDDNHQPIVENIQQLRQDLMDITQIDELVDSFFANQLVIPHPDELYQQGMLHLKIMESSDYTQHETSPIKNTHLWQESVLWLVVYHEAMIDMYYQEKDERFQAFMNFMILWKFKWFLADIIDDVSRPYSQINQYMRLFSYYCNLLDLGWRSIHKLAVMHGLQMANQDMVKTHFKLWLDAEKNDFDDCWACQVDDMVRVNVFLGQYEKALEYAQEILDGTSSCGEVPHLTNSLIVQAYFYTNQLEKAKNLLISGYDLVKGQGQFIKPIAEFMRLAIQMGDIQFAENIYQENKDLYHECESLFERMLFAIEASKLAVAEQAELLEQASRLAHQFDERHGNDYYSRQLVVPVVEVSSGLKS
ncbi:hypothetical protein [Moraxella sp. ZY210820]|uniref:hypothetical protein n=2 Tax=unclassified Moraxella TaxID=2685852 RepID=UPI00272F3BF1|nr:hypothetical protein [Moraxella sp. ZY210820]WLF84962.1 hypothetical protein LU301_05725 [Moraxella sp. ZY210820]